MSFFGPLWTSDNKGNMRSTANEQYRDIVKERYLISSHTNISYSDTLYITPTERHYLMQFIYDDMHERHERQKRLAQLKDKTSQPVRRYR